MEWVRESAPLWVPIGVGLLTAFFGGTFLTASRLRRELTADVQLLNAIPCTVGAGSHLDTSVQQRVIRLVGLTRYPPLAATDLLGIAGVISMDAVTILVALDLSEHGGSDLPTTVLGPFVFGTLAYFSARLFYRGWSRRAIARFRFLQPLLDSDEVQDLAFLLKVVNTSLALVALLLVVMPFSACVAVAAHALGSPTVVVVLVSVAAISSWWFLFIVPIAKSELNRRTSAALVAGRATGSNDPKNPPVAPPASPPPPQSNPGRE